MNLPLLYLFISVLTVLIIVLTIKNLSSKGQLHKLEDLVQNKNNLIRTQAEQIKDLEKDLKIKLKKARNIHQRMLPDNLDEPDNFFFSDYYQPAEYIGGDYYNVFKIEHGSMDPFFEQYLVYFFDVSGHGIDSTLLSIFVNDSIESYFKLQHNPGEKISTNELMNYIDQRYQKEGFPDDYLVCLFISVLDNKKNTLSYSSGGFQYPIYKVNSEAEIEKINIGGLPISTALGALEDQREEKVIAFEKDTTLVLSTDGLLEQNNGTDEYFDHFEELLNKYQFLPAPFLKDLICSDFYNFTNDDPAEDDITFLLLERAAGKIFNYHLNSDNRAEKFKNEFEQFLRDEDRDKAIIKLMKKIAYEILDSSDSKMKFKALKSHDLLMLSFEKDKNSGSWDSVLKLYPELTSIAEKNTDQNKVIKKQIEFNKNELYYSLNKQKSRIYLLFFKENPGSDHLYK